MYPGFLGIIADVDTCSIEYLAIDIDPGVTRRVLGLAQDVRAVVDAVEVDSLAIIADPIMWRGLENKD